ncbi:MAG: hypothetical protein NUW22_04720, partial [Acidobacteria bacterium]|nr:hypothetical protein [Acidobacteriota bacterium]
MARKAKTPKAPEWLDVEFVQELYEKRKSDGDEARLRGLAQTFRTMVRLEQKVTVPKEYASIAPAFRSPFMRDAHSHITAALTQKPPVAHVEPRDGTDDAKRAANVAEKWDQAAIEQMDKDLDADTIYDTAKCCVRDGESVIKLVDRPAAWAHFPKRTTDEQTGDVETA